jgi:hypothetical protein
LRRNSAKPSAETRTRPKAVRSQATVPASLVDGG